MGSLLLDRHPPGRGQTREGAKGRRGEGKIMSGADSAVSQARAAEVLRPFFEKILFGDCAGSSRNLPVPSVLSALAAVAAGRHGDAAFFYDKIERRYLRLCRLQTELSGLDFKNAPGGQSPEDFVFSSIDFTRYSEIEESRFKGVFLAGLADFGDSFFRKNFNLSGSEAKSLMESGYQKNETPEGAAYKLQKPAPLILSLMRGLETSLESLPLFTPAEIQGELDALPFAVKGGAAKIYPLLALSLDGLLVTHKDGMATKLTYTPGGDLSGTFQPGNKPWTLVLVPAA